MSWRWKNCDVSVLKGKTLKECIQTNYDSGDAIRFVTDDDEEYMMYHDQDCCEYVSIEDIVGDLQDLVGSPLLEAEESSSFGGDTTGDSYTWTYYKLGTIKGHVNIRWYGSSNGYYSERVDFALVTN